MRFDLHQKSLYMYRNVRTSMSICMVYVHLHVECGGFKSHPRQLVFLWKSDYFGCAVLLCLVVCLILLASLFLLISH